MNHNATSNTNPSYQPAFRRIAISAIASGLLMGAAACSSSDEAATTVPSVTTSVTPSSSPSSTSPPTTIVPTTAASTTIAPTTTASPPANEARRAMLTGILESHHTAGEFVGARIALLESDGTVTEVADGTSTTDAASAPVDLDEAWNIGSVTKTFVAVVVMQLADEGKIDLDAGIDGYFPDMPDADRITPRELLQHTSGLAEYGDQPAVLNDPHRVWTATELIAVAEAAGRVDVPGGPHHYANTNYTVLGEIIEKVTGNSWDDEVRTRIVEPLGMTNTHLLGGDLPVGYKLIDGSFVDSTTSMDPSTAGAAGGLVSTDRDLLKFAAGLAHGTLVSPASKTAMEAYIPGEDYAQFGIDHGYGLGIERYANDVITVDGHMGTGEAQSAFVGYDVENGTAVAVMTNTAFAGPQALMAVEALIAANTAG